MRDIVRILGSTATGGVSAKLPSATRAYQMVLFQQGKRPVDAEMNLAQQVLAEQQRQAFKALFGSGAASGWSSATSTAANAITLHNGPALMSVLVDGCLFQIGDPAASNKLTVQLTAPPGSGSRDDFIFLECWFAEVQPTSSPESASTSVYTNGGVNNATLTNDLIVLDGVESARRIQARWRVRSIAGLNRSTYPNGINAPTVLAQGDQASGQTGYTYTQDTLDTGLWTAGSGNLTSANALLCVDGYSYALPLAWVSRTAGVTSIPTSAITMLAATISTTNSDMVDGIHASATPTANMLVPLDSGGKFPSSVIPATIDAASVNGYSASLTPTANTLLPLDSTGKYPNSVLRTGAGNGLDADTVDTFHASATPTANTLLALDGNAKLPNTVFYGGSGNGFDVDYVDGYHANPNPTANTLLPLDSSGKIPNTVLRGGSGNGIDADTVDTFHASTVPGVNRLLALDSNAKFPNSVFYGGSGNNFDADYVDLHHASDFAAAVHTHLLASPVIINANPNTSMTGQSYTSLYSFTVNTSVGTYAMVALGASVSLSQSGAIWQLQVFVNGIEQGSFNSIYVTNTTQASSGGVVFLGTAGANTISIRGRTSTSTCQMTLTSLQVNVVSNYVT